MRTIFLKCLIVGSLFAVVAQAHADLLADGWQDFQRVRQQGTSTVVLDIDNDSLLLQKNDGFYTSGVRITQQYASRSCSCSCGEERLDMLGWRIGHEMYTASDIKLPPAFIKATDHPYAGWLYGGMFKEVHDTDGAFWRLGLDLGCLGPCAGGEWGQTNLHRVLDQPLPQGWSRQVRNEVGAVLYGEIAPARWSPLPWLDATPSLQGRFGNIFTDATLGVTVRAGRLNLLPDAPVMHGFLRLSGRAVAYDAPLQGGYFSRDNPQSVRPKRLLGEAEIGIAWQQAPYGIRASLVRRGNVIRDWPDAAGTQNFARLQFLYSL
jgi:lipid A 3-O-deacylase